MSNTCWIPLNYVFTRGQGIKAHSLVLKECSTLGYIMPHLNKLEGDIEFINTEEPVLAFYRALDGVKILCAFNLGAQSSELVIADTISSQHTELSHHTAELNNNKVTLPGFGCFYATLN